MYKKIFIDANIILDLFNLGRKSHSFSTEFYQYALTNAIELATSCDLITTIYYIDSKIDKTVALSHIEEINKTIHVIDFSNKEIAQTCQLMRENPNYKDLEDTIQYILAKKEGCDLIISNDSDFYAEEIPVMSSKSFIEQLPSS